MSWTLYRWVWLVRSPLHLGISPAGILNRTRLYIPARTIWGALTAELARLKESSKFPEYKAIGEKLMEKARFTYLFPAEHVQGEWLVWLPTCTNGDGLHWQRDNGKEAVERELRTRLLATHLGTAIDPVSDTAEEGSLRELECIQPFWRGGSGVEASPVAFVGYVFVSDKNLRDKIEKISELFVGADTRYGFGQLQRVRWEEKEGCFGRPAMLDNNNPRIQTDILLAHLTGTDGSFKGSLEILQQWDRDGPQIVGAVWTPGSRRSSGITWFDILPSGLWERVQRENPYGCSD